MEELLEHQRQALAVLREAREHPCCGITGAGASSPGKLKWQDVGCSREGWAGTVSPVRAIEALTNSYSRRQEFHLS